MRSTSPMRSASSASMRRALQRRSKARLVPTRRGRNQLVPCSAIRPRFEKAVVNDASGAANRRSQSMARTKPPPALTPLTAAITGFGTFRTKLNKAGNSSSGRRLDGSAPSAARQVAGVETGREPPSLACDDETDHLRIGGRLHDGFTYLLDHLGGEGIELLGALEADDRGGALHGRADVWLVRVTHAAILAPAGPRWRSTRC